MTTNATKYIDKDDYLQAKGVNLEIELQNDDNQSNKVTRFIHEVTDWCCLKLALDYQCNDLNPNLEDKWDTLPEFRRNDFRKGVIEQIQYMLDNGLISKNSGINPATGVVVDYSSLEIGSDAHKWFHLGAFENIPRERR